MRPQPRKTSFIGRPRVVDRLRLVRVLDRVMAIRAAQVRAAWVRTARGVCQQIEHRATEPQRPDKKSDRSKF
jgi:hypothetical protein